MNTSNNEAIKKYKPSPCFVCRGTGDLPQSYRDKMKIVNEKRILAHCFKSQGYSLGQIQKMIGGYKTRSGIERLLEKPPKFKDPTKK